MIHIATIVMSTLMTLITASNEDPATFAPLAKDYEAAIRPLLKQYCLKCHSTVEQEGDLDLERFLTFDNVKRDSKVWIKVVEMLDNGEMPPKKNRVLPKVERDTLRNWARSALDAMALANAGDPGPVVLRRLSNVEYNNTMRDLTGVDLQPTREFPGDGAAGEGFTNVGEALVMSPAMLDKYLAAAKNIAAHAVLLPDGFRVSEKSTRPDWTDEIVSRIKALYRRYTDPEGSTRVSLQGLVWETNAGGRVPLKPYLTVLLTNRDALSLGKTTIADVASQASMSPKYLGILWNLFNGSDPSPILEILRDDWKTATPANVGTLVNTIRQWQVVLTAFKSVGHFKPWQEAVNPLVESQAFRIKFPAQTTPKEVVLRLVTHDAGDGAEGDFLEWRRPRFEAPGRPVLLLRDLRDGLRGLNDKRKLIPDAAKYLEAIENVRGQDSKVDRAALASKQALDPMILSAWLDYLGIGGDSTLKIETLFRERIEKSGDYEFVKGWGTSATPNLIANSSDKHVRIPGIMKPHGVCVHPSPTRSVAAGWRSPIDGEVRIETRVVRAHPECGNGVSWSLERRRGVEKHRLASGEITGGTAAKIAPVEKLKVREGDLISLRIGPRSDHSCDLTDVDLTITTAEETPRSWSLSGDVSGTILAGNPHADRLGNAQVWYFYHEPLSGETPDAFANVPAGSLIDRWREEPRSEERKHLAEALGLLLAKGPAGTKTDPDTLLYQQLLSLNGPLLGRLDFSKLAIAFASKQGHEAESEGLWVKAPSVNEIRLPANVLEGREFVVDALLNSREGSNGSVQAEVTLDQAPTLSASALVAGLPIITQADRPSRKRYEHWFDDFRRVFPAALCYNQIVPVDEVVTLALYHREDENLSRLMLNEAERKTLDRLWEELEYVSQEAFQVEVGYVQFMEYTTQDSDPNLFKPLRKPIADKAAALRRQLITTEPSHLDALAAFAGKAYRRPLTPSEKTGLRKLYANLRSQDLDHEAAVRLTLARILMAPSFLYRAERPATSIEPQPVSDWELASRLSYFLWSSAPDNELRRLAEAGTLHRPDVLSAQTRRMLKDGRVRNLATEFACQWLDIRGFDTNNDKSEQVFPEFAALRGAMYEEPVRFFVDLFQRDGSVLNILDADYTFMNPALAKHYGIKGFNGPGWERVEGVKAHGRGGVLGMAATLSKHSGASRTSPILRGNWLVEMLLGEKLPKPPKNVPQLPESELDTGGLTMRQITEKHRAVESCSKCHEKIDPYGFALEGFDAIGRRREVDLAGRPVDTRAVLKNGKEFSDISGLRDTILGQRRDDFLRQFCRKLLGYSLGRATQLSDDVVLAEMRHRLIENQYHVQDAIITAVRSPQFRMQRGLRAVSEDTAAQ